MQSPHVIYTKDQVQNLFGFVLIVTNVLYIYNKSKREMKQKKMEMKKKSFNTQDEELVQRSVFA